MDASEKDQVPTLSATYLQVHENENPQARRFTSRTRSASISIPMNSLNSYESENSYVGHTGPLRSERRNSFIQMSGPLNPNRKNEKLFQPTQGSTGSRTVEKYPSINVVDQNDWPNRDYVEKNEHLLKSGQLGMCNDPYCTTCTPSSGLFDPNFHNILYGDAKGWLRRAYSALPQYIPGVMNPHAKVVQQWNKFFVISCLVAVFLDPLFFFLLSTKQDNKCIVLNWTMTTALVVFRSMTDFVYLLHMLLQFRLAYVAPESRVLGSGELVDHPKRIALNYLARYFLVDLFVVLPLPQILVLAVLPKFTKSSGANFAENFLQVSILAQCSARLYRILPMLAGQFASGFIFDSAWAIIVFNLLIFVLCGHIVGSCWYLFGLQRVNQCLRNACRDSAMKPCIKFIYCGTGNGVERFKDYPTEWESWKQNVNATACFGHDSFPYGIYVQTVQLTTKSSLITRYIYSLFWGFQQSSTLAGNLTPSYFVGEVIFIMGIISLGMLPFVLLIGNIQNYVQSLGRRRLDMSLRIRDVKKWMSHQRLPQHLREQVIESELYHWTATGGINEVMLLENLPEDLQKNIRLHLFKFVKRVRIFNVIDEPILDAICERLRRKTYIRGSRILVRGGLVDKMVFIVRGKLESIGEDKSIVPLVEGDVCGEELLTWCLEHSSVDKVGARLISNRMAVCLTHVEAFTLRAADLKEVTRLFSRFLRNPHVQGAIRYESPYWRSLAATRIQVAWRYRKKRLTRAATSSSESIHFSRT